MQQTCIRTLEAKATAAQDDHSQLEE